MIRGTIATGGIVSLPRSRCPHPPPTCRLLLRSTQVPAPIAAAAACPLWQPRYGISYVPTNAPCDPTYVGSTMGLSRPSYYGALPGPGYDAP